MHLREKTVVLCRHEETGDTLGDVAEGECASAAGLELRWTLGGDLRASEALSKRIRCLPLDK